MNRRAAEEQQASERFDWNKQHFHVANSFFYYSYISLSVNVLLSPAFPLSVYQHSSLDLYGYLYVFVDYLFYISSFIGLYDNAFFFSRSLSLPFNIKMTKQNKERRVNRCSDKRRLNWQLLY